MDEHESLVLRFVDCFASGDALQLMGMLTPEASAGARGRVDDAIRRLRTLYGSLQDRRVVQSFRRRGGIVVNVLCEFAQGSILCYAVCTAEGRIATFAFDRPKAEKYLHLLQSDPPEVS